MKQHKKDKNKEENNVAVLTSVFLHLVCALAPECMLFISVLASVAILAVRMARLIVDSALAASSGVAPALKSAQREQVTFKANFPEHRSNSSEVHVVTFGPQRACFVTQQISVLHIRQQIQSQPSFFWTMMSHRGHFMASPFCNRLCIEIQWNCIEFKEAIGEEMWSANRISMTLVVLFWSACDGFSQDQPVLPVSTHLYHLLSLLSRLVILSSDAQVVLVVFTVHPAVDGLQTRTTSFVFGASNITKQ